MGVSVQFKHFYENYVKGSGHTGKGPIFRNQPYLQVHIYALLSVVVCPKIMSQRKHRKIPFVEKYYLKPKNTNIRHQKPFMNSSMHHIKEKQPFSTLGVGNKWIKHIKPNDDFYEEPFMNVVAVLIAS